MSSIKWLKHLPDDGVYSLREAQNSLLQVLVSKFSLSRDGHGFTLNLGFKGGDSAIRRREAKKRVQNRMPGYRVRVDEVQKRIDDVFYRGEANYFHADPGFVFRYASGGTLPIVELDSKQYYCLFYRDVFPVGWNIANGACDSLSELLDPMLAIERELREELIVLALHTAPPLDYVFTWAPKPKTFVVVPEFQYARRLANRFLTRGVDIGSFRCTPLKVDWAPPGPDTLRVQFNGEDAIVQKGLYLNINAKDFGIELDRIARIRIAPETTLLDGEINDNELLNRPIGLFEIRKTQKAVFNGSTTFLPDLLFHSLAKFTTPPSSPAKFERDIIKKNFLPYLLRIKVRNTDDIKIRNKIPVSRRFDLCPVTRSIVRRHMRASRPRVFISYSHADRKSAKDLARSLTSWNIKVWRDEEEMRPVQRINAAIERAIEDSSHVLLLGSQRSVTSEYVLNEIQYASDLRKPAIVVMLENCKVPFAARRWQRIDFQDRDRYQDALGELVHALSLEEL